MPACAMFCDSGEGVRCMGERIRLYGDFPACLGGLLAFKLSVMKGN